MSSKALVDHCTFIVNFETQYVVGECYNKIFDLGFTVSKLGKEGSTYKFEMPGASRSTINAFFDVLEGKREPAENADSDDSDLPSFVIIKESAATESQIGAGGNEGLSDDQTQCRGREAEEGSETPRDEHCDRMVGSQQTETVPKEIERVQDYGSSPYSTHLETEDRDNDELKRKRVSERTPSLQNNNRLDNDFGQGKELDRYVLCGVGSESDTERKDGERPSNRHDATKHCDNDSSQNTDRGSEGDRERKQRTFSAGEKIQSLPTNLLDASASGRAVSGRKHASMKESYFQNTEQEEEDMDVDEGIQDASSMKMDRDSRSVGICAVSREVSVENDRVESRRKATQELDGSDDNEEYYDAKNDESSGDMLSGNNQALERRNESMFDGSPGEQRVLRGAVTADRSTKKTPGEPSSRKDAKDNNCQESRSSREPPHLNPVVLPDKQANMAQRDISSRPSKSGNGNEVSMPRSTKMTREEYSSRKDAGDNNCQESRSSRDNPPLNQHVTPDEQANMAQRDNSSRPSKSGNANKVSMARSTKMTQGEYSSRTYAEDNNCQESRSSRDRLLLNQHVTPDEQANMMQRDNSSRDSQSGNGNEVSMIRYTKMTQGEYASRKNAEDNNCQESRSSRELPPLNWYVPPDEQENMVQPDNSGRPSKSEKNGNKVSMLRSAKMTRGEYSSSEDEGENASHKSRSTNESLLNQFPSHRGQADDDHRGDHHRLRQTCEDHDATHTHKEHANTSSETAQTIIGENCTEEEENITDEEEQGSTTYMFTKAKYYFAKKIYRTYESVSRCLEEYEVKSSSYLVKTNNKEVIECLNLFNKSVKPTRIPKDLFRMYQKELEEWGSKIDFEEAEDCVIVLASAITLKEIGKRYPDIISPGLPHRATAMPTSRNRSNVHESPNTDATSASGCQASSRERYTIPAGTDRFEGHRSSLRVRVYNTNITLLPVDVIVNAANRHLKHGGGVAKAISGAAGRKLKDECEKHIKEQTTVDVTEHFASTGGNLKAKKVYHAVGPRWVHYKDDRQKCERDLRLTILRCLLHAEEEGRRSIAFPSISAAIFKVPKDICVASYMKAVLHFEYLRDTDSIREIHFVDIDDSMVNAIRDHFISFWNEPRVEKDPEFRHDYRITKHAHAPPVSDDTSAAPRRSIHGDGSSRNTADSKSKKDQRHEAYLATARGMTSNKETGTSFSSTGAKPGDYQPPGHSSQSPYGISSGGDVSMSSSGTSLHTYGDQTSQYSESSSSSRGKSPERRQSHRTSGVSDESKMSYAKATKSGGSSYMACEICFEIRNDIQLLQCCGNRLCKACLRQLSPPRCPFCFKAFGILRGDMPDGQMVVDRWLTDLPGYNSGQLQIKYIFHEFSSSRPYRKAYLPNTDSGLYVLRLLLVAFHRRLTFTKGQSRTTGKDNQITWNDIHHKTSNEVGATFGYPDPDYLRRVCDELKAKGVTVESLTEWESLMTAACLKKLKTRYTTSLQTPSH